MADQNLDIRVQVLGGPEASSKLGQVAGSTEQVGTATESTSKKTSGLTKSLKGIATGIAVYKGYSFLKGAVSSTESLAKSTSGLQRITGLDTQTAAGWVQTAKERGVQSKQLNMGFTSLGRNMTAAASGSKAATSAFTALGLNAAGLKVQDTTTQMGMLADSFKALPAGTDKAALAQKLFGRAGQALLPILNGGSRALRAQVDESGKATGMNTKTMKSALQLAAQQRKLSTAMVGVKVAIGSALIPILTQLTGAIAPVMDAFGKLMQTSPIFRGLIYALAAAFTALKIAMFFGASASTGGIIGLIIGIGTLLVMAYQKVGWFRDAVNAAFDFIKAHWVILLGVLVGPLGIVAGLIITHFTAVKNAAVAAFNWLKNAGVNAFHAVGAAAGAVVGAVRVAFNAVKGVVNGVAGAFRSAGGAAARAFSSAFHGVVGTVTGIINGLKSVIGSIAGAFKSVFGGAVTFVSGLVDTLAQSVGKVSSAISTVKSVGGGIADVVSGRAVGIHAEGGRIGPSGQLSLVGERGPEIVALPGSSTVIPNRNVSLGAGGVVHTHVYLNGREIAQALGSYTADKQAAR